MFYQVSYDSSSSMWYADNRKFRSKLAAIQHIQDLPEMRGYEGRIIWFSEDRVEVHFDALSRFSSLAE